MRSEALPLVVGLPGPTVDRTVLSVVGRIRPAGIILFARNIETMEQVQELQRSIEELEPRPFVAVDLEGGAVNRLERLWGPLPSPASAGAAGRRSVRALGTAAGAACRALGIHLDLAPVVDLHRSHGAIGRAGRCFSDDPERVVTLARVFSEGLSEWGVAGCLKHFPGLGAITADTHEVLPADPGEESLETHLRPFEELSEQIPVVMIGHVVVPSIGDAERPASLSRSVIDRAAGLPGSPVVLSDDVEMGALDSWGDLPERVVSALRARNHGVLVCKAFERLQEIVEHIEQAAASDPSFESRVDQLGARLSTLGRDLCRNAAAIPAPDGETVAQLWDTAREAARQ